MKIGVIGADGLIGKAVVYELKEHYDITRIRKRNYKELIGSKFNILINCNGNSSKHLANKNPIEDFKSSVNSVMSSMFDFEYEKYIYMSSLDAEEDSSYGLHKRLSELIIKHYTKRHYAKHVILRSSAVIGKEVEKGFFFDAYYGRPLYVNSKSIYQLITNVAIAKTIKALINLDVVNETFYIGSTDAIQIKELGELLNKKLTYKKNTKYECYFRDVSKINKLYNMKTTAEYIKDVLS